MKSFELKRTQLDNDKTSFTRKIDKLEQEKKKIVENRKKNRQKTTFLNGEQLLNLIERKKNCQTLIT